MATLQRIETMTLKTIFFIVLMGLLTYPLSGMHHTWPQTVNFGTDEFMQDALKRAKSSGDYEKIPEYLKKITKNPIYSALHRNLLHQELSHAISSKIPTLIQMLTENGVTPLGTHYMAAFQKYPEILPQLKNYDNLAPTSCCHASVTQNILTSIQFFFSKKDHETACYCIQKLFQMYRLKQLTNLAGLTITINNEELTLIHIAAYYGAKNILEECLTLGLNTTPLTSHNKTIFHCLASAQQSVVDDIFTLILKQARIPSLSSPDLHKKTPLHYAFSSQNISYIKTLINHGAQLSHTLAFAAASCCPYEITQRIGPQLLEFINQPDEWDTTPFIAFAQWCTDKKTLQFLLNHGANAHWKDKRGKTAFLNALKYLPEDCVSLFLQKPLPQITTQFFEQIITAITSNPDKDTIAALVFTKYPELIKYKTVVQKTTLHIAAENNLIKTVKYLSKNFFSLLDQKTSDQKTAVDIALSKDLHALANILISNGASLPEQKHSPYSTMMHTIHHTLFLQPCSCKKHHDIAPGKSLIPIVLANQISKLLHRLHATKKSCLAEEIVVAKSLQSMHIRIKDSLSPICFEQTVHQNIFSSPFYDVIAYNINSFIKYLHQASVKKQFTDIIIIKN